MIYKCQGEEGCKGLFSLSDEPELEALRVRVRELEEQLGG